MYCSFYFQFLGFLNFFIMVVQGKSLQVAEKILANPQ